MAVPEQEMRDVTLVSYTNDKDDYGQRRRVIESTKTIQMIPRIYSQAVDNNPQYNDVQMIGLTTEKGITSSNSVIIDGVTYNVKFTVPTWRFDVIYMSKVKN